MDGGGSYFYLKGCHVSIRSIDGWISIIPKFVRNSSRTWQHYVSRNGEWWVDNLKGPQARPLVSSFQEYSAMAQTFLKEIRQREDEASRAHPLSLQSPSIGSNTHSASRPITAHPSLGPGGPSGNPPSVAGSFSPGFCHPSPTDWREMAPQSQLFTPNMPYHPSTIYSAPASVEPILAAVDTSQHESLPPGVTGHAEATAPSVHHEVPCGLKTRIDRDAQEEYLGRNLLRALNRPADQPELDLRGGSSATRSNMVPGSYCASSTHLSSVPPVEPSVPHAGGSLSSFSGHCGTRTSFARARGDVWDLPWVPTVPEPGSDDPRRITWKQPL